MSLKTKCKFCGFQGEHPGLCPSVKAIEYYANGKVKRVEMKAATDFQPLTVGPTVAGWPSNIPIPTTMWPYVTTSVGTLNGGAKTSWISVN